MKISREAVDRIRIDSLRKSYDEYGNSIKGLDPHAFANAIAAYVQEECAKLMEIRATCRDYDTEFGRGCGSEAMCGAEAIRKL